MRMDFRKPVRVVLDKSGTVKKSEICTVNGCANQHTCLQKIDYVDLRQTAITFLADTTICR